MEAEISSEIFLPLYQTPLRNIWYSPLWELQYFQGLCTEVTELVSLLSFRMVTPDGRSSYILVPLLRKGRACIPYTISSPFIGIPAPRSLFLSLAFTRKPNLLLPTGNPTLSTLHADRRVGRTDRQRKLCPVLTAFNRLHADTFVSTSSVSWNPLAFLWLSPASVTLQLGHLRQWMVTGYRQTIGIRFPAKPTLLHLAMSPDPELGLTQSPIQLGPQSLSSGHNCI
jgi:hypothetical protein